MVEIVGWLLVGAWRNDMKLGYLQMENIKSVSFGYYCIKTLNKMKTLI
jgi:hypothetical protein